MSRQSKLQNRVIRETTAGNRATREARLALKSEPGHEARAVLYWTLHGITGLLLTASLAAMANLLF